MESAIVNGAQAEWTHIKSGEDSMEYIEVDQSADDLIHKVETLSRTSLSRCWHCFGCSGGCPIAEDMDYMPNEILRMIQFGMLEKVLQSSSIWMCVGCNTCSTQCPNAVDIAAIMDALRQMAIEENAAIAEPKILSFHKEVVNSIARYGRTHKLEIMMRYKLAEKDFFTDSMVGLKMLFKRKLELFPSKVQDKKSLKTILDMGGAT